MGRTCFVCQRQTAASTTPVIWLISCVCRMDEVAFSFEDPPSTFSHLLHMVSCCRGSKWVRLNVMVCVRHARVTDAKPPWNRSPDDALSDAGSSNKLCGGNSLKSVILHALSIILTPNALMKCKFITTQIWQKKSAINTFSILEAGTVLFIASSTI